MEGSVVTERRLRPALLMIENHTGKFIICRQAVTHAIKLIIFEAQSKQPNVKVAKMPNYISLALFLVMSILSFSSVSAPTLSTFQSAPIRDRWEWGNCNNGPIGGDVLAESHTIYDAAGHYIVNGHKMISQLDCNALTVNDVGGVGYLGSSTPFFDSGDLIFTVLYGLNITPGCPLNCPTLELTGFNPLIASSISISETKFIGVSGSEYNPFFISSSLLSELPSLLPGYDLSLFHGDPNSVIYLFQTTIPAFDTLAVPEPSTLSCIFLALMFCAYITKGGTAAHLRTRVLTTEA